METYGISGSPRKSRRNLGNLRRSHSAHRPLKFSAWALTFSVWTLNFYVLLLKLALKFSAAGFQQPEPTKKKSKLDQTNSDWAEILHTPYLWSFQGVHKIWAPNNQGNFVDREIFGPVWGFLNFPQNSPILCSWGIYSNWLADMFLMCHSTYPSTPINPLFPKNRNHPRLRRRGFGRVKTQKQIQIILESRTRISVEWFLYFSESIRSNSL